MKKPFLLIVLLALLLILLDLVRNVWLGKGEAPSEAYKALLTPPPRPTQDPMNNAYLFMLGFSSSPSADPLHVGHDMWLEVQSDPGRRPFDYGKESRSELRVPDEIREALQPQGTAGRIGQLRSLADPEKNILPPHALLIDRYRQWLALPFDDWGDGHPGAPRLMDLYTAHRLYLVEAWAQDTSTALDRLGKDLAAWRGVLGNAKTLPLKVFAATIVDEDAALVSEALNLSDFDAALLPRLDPLVRPLTPAERSLRRPIQNEFVVGVALFEHPLTSAAALLQPESESQNRWISALAGLGADSFQSVHQPIPANILSRSPMQKQRTLNTYADFCEATIRAADLPNSPFPKLLDMARLTHRRFLDYFVNPIDNIFASGPEPAWAPLADRLLRTDARLRLAALHARLLRPGRDLPTASRIVQAGSAFYDPFSGFPMLWSAASNKLYSVGEDRNDDGGDEPRDIPIAILPTPAAGVMTPTHIPAQAR
nr:hypothetical protein [Nitrospirota bacterium]